MKSVPLPCSRRLSRHVSKRALNTSRWSKVRHIKNGVTLLFCHSNDCANLEPYICIYLFLFLKDGFSHHSGIIITIEEFQGILYRPRI